MILGLNEFKKCILWPIFGLVKISVGSNQTPLTTLYNYYSIILIKSHELNNM